MNAAAHTPTMPTPILHPPGRGTLHWSLSTRRRTVTSSGQSIRVIVEQRHGVETFRRCTPRHELQTELAVLDSGDITERLGHLHLRFARTALEPETLLRLADARLFKLRISKRLLDITAKISTHGDQTDSRIRIRLTSQLTLTYFARLKKETAA